MCPSAAEDQPQGALLVGSVSSPDAETTFRKAVGTLGRRLRRVPDGEPGERWYWINFQAERLARAEGLERVGDEPVEFGGFDLRPVTLRPGVDPADVRIGPLGYADGALESWEVFQRLQSEGVIPADVRFQVSLPTPLAVIEAWVAQEDRARLEPVYAAVLYGELARILDAIPHDRLAIQWDVAVEFALIEGASYPGVSFTPWFDDVWQAVISRAADQAAHVPVDVELGYHLCYGDLGERHFVEPRDTTNLAGFITRLLAVTPRPINWFHLPVPIDRDDDAYFVPLESLELPASTELYLGLVHREDGVQGAERRIGAALRHTPRFGVAGECGLGRAGEENTQGLLDTHRDVAAAW